MAKKQKRKQASKRRMSEAEMIELVVNNSRARAWKDKTDAMAEGRIQRSNTFADRRKKESREACRGKVTNW
jgi:hypothetical protein